MTWLDLLKVQLTADEGRRNLMYKDSVGVYTVGIGHNMNVPLSDRVVDMIFEDDTIGLEAQCRSLYPQFDTFTDARKAALANMLFNLGKQRLATFNVFNQLVNAGKWGAAADDCLTTLWAKQVGARAVRISNALRKG